ncbi:porin [Olivibacter sp. SDN3]|uniref:porin n=1 Tax=Olivibacter sp. SDN3 TaxID=2764720 RepID=UPI0016513B45|nr:porin [Olivibacter sp. SDN3]QNL52179.1 porin [Olivibacter sp. SDN3]
MKKIIVASLMLLATKGFAQTDSTKSPLTFSGYLETYYAYDFGNPSDHNRPGFAYSFNRHNEVNLNLGFVKAAYQTDKVRANLALAAGTYMNANLAAEPGVLKNIYEANAGVKISKTKDLWIDAGIFASHIGFESAVGKDCWNLTRSILADNSPYYESGAKISYTTDNGKWFISGLILNGWQRIQRVDGDNTPAFGHQLTYKPNSKITLNSSSFVGSDKPDSTRQMRYFHNFYGQFQLHEKFALIAGFDIGAEQKAKGSDSYNVWYSPVLIVKYSPAEKHSIAVRGEYYSDENGVIIGTETPNGFQTFGYSLNYDYLIMDNVMWRIEAKGFSSEDKVFLKDGNPTNNNLFLTTSLAISF